MTFSHFFIRRPIFAAVLSIFTVLLGGIALLTLPVAQYPEITPPTIFVMANYPGANAETMANTVATPIEEQINGVEDMLYLSAQCASDGSMRLAVTFKVGTNPNMAQVLVQNRVDLALPRLPDVVRQLGVTVRKRSPTIAMLISLVSPSGKYNAVYLSNYAYLHVQDVLRRLPGVGDTIIFGARDYAIRIWLDPDKVSARNLTAGRRGRRDSAAERRGGCRPVRPGAPTRGQPVSTGHSAQRPAHQPRRNSRTSSSRPMPTARLPVCATWPA